MYLEDYLASLASGRPQGGSELSTKDRDQLQAAGVPIQIGARELEGMGPAYRNQLMRDVARGKTKAQFTGDRTPREVEDLLTASKLAPLFNDQASLEQFFGRAYGRQAPTQGANLSIGGVTPEMRFELGKIELNARVASEAELRKKRLEGYTYDPETRTMKPLKQDPYSKLEKVPNKEVGEYAGYTSGISSIDDAKEILKGGKIGNIQGQPGSFGGLAGSIFGRTPFVGGQLLNMADPEGVGTRAFVKNIASAVRREIAGQAVSGGEALFTEDMIPQVYDEDAVVETKLNAIQEAFKKRARTLETQFNPQTGYRPLSARGDPEAGVNKSDLIREIQRRRSGAQ
jgi:hypothetical protein